MPDRAERAPVSRELTLRTALRIADEGGLTAVSMRAISSRLGVVPMALYKHVRNKDDLLDGLLDAAIVDVVVPEEAEWREAVRGAVLSARRAYAAHPWLREIIEVRGPTTPRALAYLDALGGRFLAGGLTPELVHHAMHALGHRVWGFSPDGVRNLGQGEPDADPGARAAFVREMARRYPSIATITFGRRVDPQRLDDDDAAAVPPRCDEDAEFAFTLDLLLQAFARLHDAGWSPPLPNRDQTLP